MANDLIARAHALAEESFLAGSGPGGQNANKVATEVQLRVNTYKLRLPPAVFARLRTLAGSKLTTSGDLLVTAKQHRTQEANRAEAREKLEALLREWPTGRALYFADELGGQPAIEAFAAHDGPAALLIGPEGGFTPAERDRLRSLDFVHAVSLGPRILRAETAVISALTLWQSVCGDWE